MFPPNKFSAVVPRVEDDDEAVKAAVCPANKLESSIKSFIVPAGALALVRNQRLGNESSQQAATTSLFSTKRMGFNEICATWKLKFFNRE